MMRALKSLAVALVLLSLVSGRAAFGDDSSGARLFSPDSEPYGRSYAQWLAEFQEWYNEIPTPENPLVEGDSPHNCDLEDGKVVFVGAPTDCRVPEHKAVAFAGDFWECSTAEGLGETYAELRRCAVDNFAKDFNPDIHHVRLWIDGERVANPERWTFLTPIPSDLIEFPEDNIWGAEAGLSKSVTKGAFYILRPLSEGTHTIKFKVQNELSGEATFIYKLRVD
jgi:hypothetical protein